MIHVSDEVFEQMIADAIDALPDRFLDHAKNVAIVWDHDPTPQQRVEMKLRPYESLYGLYQGIPLTRRGDGYNLVLPDKITIFKNPILHSADSIEAAKKQVLHTLWHEIAHHYGLDHDRIHELEDS